MNISPRTWKGYLTQLISIALFVALLLIISSLILIAHSSTLLRGKQIEFRNQQLQQIRTMMDDVVMNTISEFYLENILLPDGTIPIGRFLDGSKEVPDFRIVLKRLNQYLLNEEAIDCIILFNPDRDMILGNTIGMNFNYESRKELPVYAHCNELLSRSRGSREGEGFFSNRRPTGNGEFEDILYYFKKVRIKGSSRNSVYLIGFNGKVLFSRAAAICGSEPVISLLYKKNGILESSSVESAGDPGSGSDEKNIVRLSDDSDFTGISYEMTVPGELMNEEISLLNRILIIDAVIMLLVSIAAGELFSFYISRPVLRVFGRLRSMTSTREEEGLRTMEQMVDLIDLQLEERKEILKKNKEINRYRLFQDILDGNLRGPEELKRYNSLIADMNIEADTAQGSLLLLDWEPNALEQMPPEDEEIAVEGLMNTLKTELDRQGRRYLTFSHPRGQIPIVILGKTLLSERESRQLFEALRTFSSFALPTLTALEESFPLWRGRPFYKRLLKARMNSFLYGFGRLQYVREHDKDSDINLEQEILSGERLRGLILEGDADAIRERLSTLCAFCRENRCSINALNGYLELLCRITEKTAGELKADDTLSRGVLVRLLQNAGTLDAFLQGYFDILGALCGNIPSGQELLNRNLIGGVKNYVRTNLNKNMSLESVALHFQLSSGHFSKLFKEYGDENFSDFLKRTRIEQAAGMIESGDYKTIGEIREILGYQTSTYFARIFREVHGVSPAKYQKLHRNKDGG